MPVAHAATNRRRSRCQGMGSYTGEGSAGRTREGAHQSGSQRWAIMGEPLHQWRARNRVDRPPTCDGRFFRAIPCGNAHGSHWNESAVWSSRTAHRYTVARLSSDVGRAGKASTRHRFRGAVSAGSARMGVETAETPNCAAINNTTERTQTRTPGGRAYHRGTRSASVTCRRQVQYAAESAVAEDLPRRRRCRIGPPPGSPRTGRLAFRNLICSAG